MTLIPPALGALFSSFVAVLVIAFLDTDLGRDTAERLEGPGRALVTAPVLVMCAVIFIASVAAMALPAQRQRLQSVSLLTAWLIAAWAVMAVVVLAGLDYASDRINE